MRSLNFDLVRQNPRPRVIAKDDKESVAIAPGQGAPPPATEPGAPKPPPQTK